MNPMQTYNYPLLLLNHELFFIQEAPMGGAPHKCRAPLGDGARGPPPVQQKTDTGRQTATGEDTIREGDKNTRLEKANHIIRK